eukprot:jgi/Psemu1/321642/estExt_fgenesh1_pg.C_60057
MDSRHVKTINTDSRSNKRIRFASSKERSKKASADVYRSYKRRIGGGVTSAATREQFVHNPRDELRPKKRHKLSKNKGANTGKQDDLTAFVKISDESTEQITKTKEDDMELEISTTFASEIDIAIDRNASEIFSKFHREIWMLVRSLPEILHNLDSIVDLLMSYMLSPASLPERPSPTSTSNTPTDREEFVINHATTDILHLLSVLARDLRHEIHPYLHTKILPRVVQDLLNPPPPPPESKKQPIPLDVTIVETAFRTISYIFRYDSNLVNDMESMRKYYGITLGHRRELIRRLSAETFAPQIRKIKSHSARERHIRRVLRALASTTAQPASRILQRTQTEAVDGISNLVYQLIKGVPGKLHSQGGRILKFILEYSCRDNNVKGSDEETTEDLVFNVASGVVRMLRYHFDEVGFATVCNELFSLFSVSVDKYTDGLKEDSGRSNVPFHPITKSLKLVVEIASVGSGKFIQARSDDELTSFCSSISKVCSGVCLASLAVAERCSLFSLLSNTWPSVQERECANIEDNIQSALKSQSRDVKSSRSMSLIFAKELVPVLNNVNTRNAVISKLISASAHMTKSDPNAAIDVVFAIVSSVSLATMSPDDLTKNRGFELFGSITGDDLNISQDDQQLLLDACLAELKNEKDSKEKYAHLCLNMRCVPFLAGLNGVEKKTYTKIVDWLLECSNTQGSTNALDTVVVKGMAIEAFSSITLEATESSIEPSAMKKRIVQFRSIAGELLLEFKGSVWAARGAASLVPVLERYRLGPLIDHADNAFDSLMANLRSANHFLRLYALQIMASYPEKHFVVDHADLDLTDDLDEEQGYHPSGEEKKNTKGPMGPCDLVKVLLRLESSPVRLEDERTIGSLIGKVEILARTRRMPAVYAEVAANHMMGLFNVKFAPMWQPAEKALLSLALAHEAIVWPPFETKLVDVMKGNPMDTSAKTESDEDDEFDELSSKQEHFDACRRWEESDGKNVTLFKTSLVLVEGEVPCYRTTDALTVMESIWKVAELAHRIVAKHSRGIVPLFFSFLKDQYFFFHSNDQDARELHLNDCITSEDLKVANIQGFVVQKRLQCFLRTFSEIEGPKQLVQYGLLEKIFRSFLSHSDLSIVGDSLSCLVRFKFDYLTPYQKHLREILQKGKLRTSLINLSEVIESGKMADKDRKLLLPILARILFGRITSKSGRSSNDTPASRRSAILSFMSVICKEEEDFFPFLYLMTRCFIPKTETLKLVEQYEPDDRSNILDALMTTRPADLDMLPSPVVEGFLNLLQSVLSQFGHHVVSWIPQMTSVTVELCKFVRVTNDSMEAKAVDSNPETEQNKKKNGGLRRSSVRGLCFQRLSDIFALFGSSIDFTFASEPLWFALEPSLGLLPEMVIRNDGCPALLILLQTMSSDQNLIKLLNLHEHAIKAVVKCISAASKTAVVQSSLTVIENLLSITDEDSVVVGKELVCKFAPLLMEQFTLRFEGRQGNEDPDDNNRPSPRMSLKNSPTWRRELQILFRICELVSFDDWNLETDEISFFETLCHLLIPFLEPNRGTLNEDKTNVLGILNRIVTKLEPEIAHAVFWRLSSILAPNKAKVGIEMLSIRSGIATLIEKAAKKTPDLETVAAVVVKLSSVDKKRVDEIDFDIVIPELLSFTEGEKGTNTWKDIYARSDSKPIFLTPIINIFFHFLHNEDGVISRASFNGLKSLVVTASSCIHEENEYTSPWIRMVESVLVPLTRAGLQCKDTKARRYYILLIREFATNFSDVSSANLCGDLGSLCNAENEDLDFFLAITHVQIHRRARAFQRLRKTLSQMKTNESESKLSSQSLSNVLMPIALHPIYECKMRSEEGFVLDSIATLGTIARNLPWNKYNNMLWLVLNQFDRFPEQERYSVAALCAIIDGFDFELTKQSSEESSSPIVKTSVWNSLENRIIPKIEGLLTKETLGKDGTRGKTIRPAIILALVKLFKKFPEQFFDLKLPSILAVICDALRNKDSTARDVARNTMAKMVCSIDLKYLGDAIREVAITLNEGYKLHVRAATLHTILLELLKVYEPPAKEKVELESVPFDDCTAAIMDLIQDDLFGVANERRESRDTNVRFVKEAGGNKSVHSIEMLCRMVSFAPLKATSRNQSTSAVHCIISPLLERLRQPDIDAKTIRKVKEVLSRVAIGFSNNKSLKGSQLFPFVYATVHPFIGNEAIATVANDEDDSDDEDGNGVGIKISGRKKTERADKTKPNTSKASVVEWRPSTLDAAESGKSAVNKKKSDSHKLRKVQDGASAPKLTGSSRHNLLDTLDIRTINEPATITAIVFGLNLMNASLKKLDVRDDKSLAMMDPFVPMLTACVCHCRDTEVALVALKCLLVLLRCNLPSIPSCSKSLGSKTLILLTAAGSSLNTNHDLTQACFRTLTHLIGNDAKAATDGETLVNSPSPKVNEKRAIAGGMPLTDEQMKALISLIQGSITDSDQHNPALNLIKVILIRRYKSPELYDLMESMMKLVVRSPKATLRQECAKLFVRYLLDYPMGEARFEQHLKQVVANIGYEYQEGRMSGIMLLHMLIEKIPQELLQKHSQHIFLPLVLQFLNDDSKDCREQVSNCIVLLFKRSSAEILKTFQDYCSRWSKQTGPLRLASLQVFGLLVDSRAEFIKISSLEVFWIRHLEETLRERDDLEWETVYFSLVCIEKLMKDFQTVLVQQVELMTIVTECLVDPHPWIKLSSSRVLSSFFATNSAVKFLSQKNGLLFEIVRNILFQLNASEGEQSQDLSELGIKTLTLALPLMIKHPELCYNDEKSTDEDPEGDDTGRDPLFWMMRRLSQIAKSKGSKRRMAVFKCYAAFGDSNFEAIATHLELMLEGLHRSSTEAKNEIELQSLSQKGSSAFGRQRRESNPNSSPNNDAGLPVTEHDMAEEVLALLEEKCTSSSDFLNAYAEVKRRAYNKKQRRKTEEKAEAVQNPEAAAERRIQKQQRNKKRRKRRSEEKTRDRRGGEKKYRFK